MKNTVLTYATNAAGQILAEDPGVDFDWTFFPFLDTLRQMVGGFMAITLIVTVVLLVAGAIVWAAGRVTGSQGMQKGSAMGMGIVLLAAIVIGSANALIGWVSNVETGF